MAIISKEGKLLLTKRQSKMIFPNAWVLPGGHLDLGESLEQCIVREIQEETGIIIEDDGIKPFAMFESASGSTNGTKMITSGHLIIFYKV
jgi:mutator protein MutT